MKYLQMDMDTAPKITLSLLFPKRFFTKITYIPKDQDGL